MTEKSDSSPKTKVRITSDGTPAGTRVLVGDRDVTADLELSHIVISGGKTVTAWLCCDAVELDVVAERSPEMMPADSIRDRAMAAASLARALERSLDATAALTRLQEEARKLEGVEDE